MHLNKCNFYINYNALTNENTNLIPCGMKAMWLCTSMFHITPVFRCNKHKGYEKYWSNKAIAFMFPFTKY